MDFDPLIQRKRERFEQLECEIADPKLCDNRKRAGGTRRQHANIKTVLAKWDELENARKRLDDNRELATSRDMKIVTRLSKFAPARAETKPPFSRPIFTGCIPATPSRQD